MKKCYFCNNYINSISYYSSGCKACHVLHYYDNNILDYIEIFFKSYYILIDFRYKTCSLNNGIFHKICDLDFNISNKINPSNIEYKINTMLVLL